jgi:hypothetical protein
MEVQVGLLYLMKFLWKAHKEKKFDLFYFLVAATHLYPEGQEITAVALGWVHWIQNSAAWLIPP